MPANSPAHDPRRRRRTNRLLATAAGVLTAGALAAAALPGSATAGENHGGKDRSHGHHHGRGQEVQLLSFNDLHGNLEPPSGSSGRVTELQPDGTTKTIDAGGVEYLATHLSVQPGTPVLVMHQVVVDSTEHPVLASTIRYAGERYRLRTFFARSQKVDHR